MTLKNAAILLFACSIVGIAGDVLNNIGSIVEMTTEPRALTYLLVSLLADVGFLLVAMAFKKNHSAKETARSSGLFLAIAAGCWVFYYGWVLGARITSSDAGTDYYLWFFFILAHTVTSMVLGIAIVSGNPARMRLAGLFACIGAAMWTSWLIFRFLFYAPYYLYTSADPLRTIGIFTDYAVPVGLFFFGMALFRSPGRSARADIIDEI